MPCGMDYMIGDSGSRINGYERRAFDGFLTNYPIFQDTAPQFPDALAAPRGAC
jgi:hypothetical protein